MRLFALAVLALALPVVAQTSIPVAPVLYDTDLLSADFHAGRRAAVLASLPDDAVAVFFGAPVRNRLNDTDFAYRQDNDLYYLTGTPEPGSALVLVPGGVEVDGETVTEVLFIPERDPGREVWTGRRLGVERAEAQLGVAKAVPNTRFEEIAGPLLAERAVYHLPLPEGVAPGDLARQLDVFHANATPFELGSLASRLFGMLSSATAETFEQVQGSLRGLAANPNAAAAFEDARRSDRLAALIDAFEAAESFDAWTAERARILDGVADGTSLRATLSDLRAIKTDEEMGPLRRAIDVTAAAQREAMRSIEPGMAEYEVEALIEYVFARNGSEAPGFASIVGSGENATVLHYETNRRRMEAGDLVVMDIGAEVHGYSADVTRTVPVDGTFSDEQRTIYELVLRAQEAGIEATRAGRGFRDPHQAAAQVIVEGLTALGLIDDPSGVRRFFMHGTSHYLGLDVHDVGSYGALRPGEVITVEPGIYIAPAEDVDPKWWNIGVRIEDDVLVTDGDPVVLSAGAPRDVAAIEALMAERGLGNDPAGLVE